jgi:hypothetical protein
MLKLLLFMHHIVLCISCIAHLIIAHIYAYKGRSRGARIEISNGASPIGVQRSTSIKL